MHKRKRDSDEKHKESVKDIEIDTQREKERE